MQFPNYHKQQLNQIFNLLPWRQSFTHQRFRRVKQCVMVLILTWLIGACWVGYLYQERHHYFNTAKRQLNGYQSAHVKPATNLYSWRKRQTAILKGLHASQEQQWLVRTLTPIVNTAIGVGGKIQTLSITRTLDNPTSKAIKGPVKKPTLPPLSSKDFYPLASNIQGRFIMTTPLPWAQIDHQLKLNKTWVLHTASQPDVDTPDWRLEIVTLAK